MAANGVPKSLLDIAEREVWGREATSGDSLEASRAKQALERCVSRLQPWTHAASCDLCLQTFASFTWLSQGAPAGGRPTMHCGGQ